MRLNSKSKGTLRQGVNDQGTGTWILNLKDPESKEKMFPLLLLMDVHCKHS